MAKTETLNVQLILDYTAAGMKPSEIATKLSTEDAKVTHQAITKVIKDNKPEEETATSNAPAKTSNPVKAELVPPAPIGCITRTAAEYAEYSLSQGRTRYGGVKGVKVKATPEELRALINSHWTPSMCMEKWQYTETDLKWLVRELSELELRDKDIICNFKQDFFRSTN